MKKDKNKTISKARAEAQAKKLRETAIPIFMQLKAIELLGLSASTIGIYWYGRLFYYLTGFQRPNWFATWNVGLVCFLATIFLIYLAYLIIGKAWLGSNWKWAKQIAAKRLKYT